MAHFIEREDVSWINNNLQTSYVRMTCASSFLRGKYIMDVVALDKHLKKHFGYTEEKHGSMQDFIRNEMGEDSLKTITRLLDINYQKPE